MFFRGDDMHHQALFNQNKTPVFLAPMAGVYDYPVRRLYREVFDKLKSNQNDSLYCFTELLSAKALSLKDKKTLSLIPKDEINTSIQLFGSCEYDFLKALEFLQNNGINKPVDINLGCSVKKVMKSGAGIKLMESPDNLVGIIKTIKSLFKLPVSVKARLGYKEVLILKIAPYLEEAGLDFITLHPRLGKETYANKPRWEYIKLLKDTLKIPVIGNGNITNTKQAKEMLILTNCDGIMIGRGAMGLFDLPYIIYSSINEAVPQPILPSDSCYPISQEQTVLAKIKSSAEKETDEAVPQPKMLSISERIKLFYTLINYYLEEYKEKKALVQIRKHLCWGIKFFKGAKTIRPEIMAADSVEEILKIISRLEVYLNY
ncbi:MAG: tRNA-dihydrouridine synthase family protein [Candidatus Hydrogenedentota bacterium]